MGESNTGTLIKDQITKMPYNYVYTHRLVLLPNLIRKVSFRSYAEINAKNHKWQKC